MFAFCCTYMTLLVLKSKQNKTDFKTKLIVRREYQQNYVNQCFPRIIDESCLYNFPNNAPITKCFSNFNRTSFRLTL